MARSAMCGGTAEHWTREMAMGGGLSVDGPLSGMLVVKVQLEGHTWWALVDTGCSVTLFSVTAVMRHCVRGWRECVSK